MAGHQIAAARLLTDAARPPLADRVLTVADGRIAAIAAADGSRRTNLVLPALANAHDHARVVRASQVGSFDVPLEAWLPYLSLVPAVDAWLAAAVALGRSARGGVAAVMAHYTRVQGLTDLPAEARAVAQAARDVGIRLALAVQCRDTNPITYDPHRELLARLSPASCACVTRRFLQSPLPPEAQVALVEAIAADVEREGVTVQYGPAAVQWCSDPLLRQIAESSARSGRRVHMHLLESRYQRQWADRTFPQGIVRYLDEIGLLNERLSLAHGTWLRPQELELIAARGATIVVNTSSNLVLSSGMAPVGEMLRRGCRVAMGLDGLAVDEDEDALRELRLAYLLHKATGFDIRMRREDALRMAFEHGRFAVTGMRDGGRIAVGAPADLLVLDWKRLSRELVEPDVDVAELLLAKARQEHVRQLLVGGREVVRDGAVTGVDLPALEAELLSALRKAAATTADIRAAMPELRAALRSHYREPLYCA